MKRLWDFVDYLQNRPVRHIWLHKAIHVWFVAIAVIVGSIMNTLEWHHLIRYPLDLIPGCCIAWAMGWSLGSFTFARGEMYNARHVEVVSLEPLNEPNDQVIMFKAHFAVTKGLGRLSRTHMEWDEVVGDLRTGKGTIMKSSTDK